MGIKEELLKLRNKIEKVHININDNSQIDDKDNYVTKESIDLNILVEKFINWYSENMIESYYNDVGKYHCVKNIRNFIEKTAIWYELKYPDYEVNRLMHSSGDELVNINNIMFKNNPYINNLLGEKSDIQELEWDEFYNANVFIKSLPLEERFYLLKPKFKEIVYFDPNIRGAHLHLTPNGFVEIADDVARYTNGEIKDEEIEGLHLDKLLDLFKEKGIELPKNNELEKELNKINNCKYQKEELLNCVMYRIIERGGNRIGPRRGFLFAKEFNRDIDIPMSYGFDYSDPELKAFINEYIKAGGSKDLKCYEDYFWKINNKDKVNTVSIQKILLDLNDYTSEEIELYQKLVNVLNSQVDQDYIKNEEVKRLRLERKLAKSSKVNK